MFACGMQITVGLRHVTQFEAGCGMLLSVSRFGGEHDGATQLFGGGGPVADGYLDKSLVDQGANRVDWRSCRGSFL